MSSSKNYVNLSSKYDRVIVLVDMDCFYCQVEEKLNPSLAGKPIAVVQYNAWKGGGIIAVNYPARERGVTRHMRGDEAKENCPDIELVRVPNVREKADLTKYREAGKQVAAVLQTYTNLLERASVDEAYLDITEKVIARLAMINQGKFDINPSELENTYAVGYDNVGEYVQQISTKIVPDNDDFDYDESDLESVQKSDIKLLIGGSIANEIRAKVKEETGYDCSAGIAHNKILAKLACGINKPNKQTILPLRQIDILFDTLPLGKIKGLGGKFGEDVCERLKIRFVGDLRQYSESELQQKFDEKNGSWLHFISKGIDLETVTPRFNSKSIGCCKKFPGRNAITGLETLNHWLHELSNEICDRTNKDIAENNRRAKQMIVSYIQEVTGEDVSCSRSTNLVSYDPEDIARDALEIIRKNTEHFLVTNSKKINNPIKFLGISVSKFEPIETHKYTIDTFFKNQPKKSDTDAQSQNKDVAQISVSNTTPKENTPKGNVLKSFFANHLKKKTTSPNDSIPILPTISVSEVLQSNETEHTKTDASQYPAEDSNILSFLTQTNTQQADQSNWMDSNIDTVTPKEEAESYTKTYAEFLVPQIEQQNFVICEKCNKKILSCAVESHMDYHFALEISQEQRKQFREDIKTKFSSPPNKKPKLSSGLGKTNNKTNPVLVKNSLKNFFCQPASEAVVVDSKPGSSKDFYEQDKCEECGKYILKKEMAEHIDYHVARKLQIEINNTQVERNTIDSQNKQKSKKDIPKTKTGLKTKSINTFFLTQNSKQTDV